MFKWLLVFMQSFYVAWRQVRHADKSKRKGFMIGFTGFQVMAYVDGRIKHSRSYGTGSRRGVTTGGVDYRFTNNKLDPVFLDMGNLLAKGYLFIPRGICKHAEEGTKLKMIKIDWDKYKTLGKHPWEIISEGFVNYHRLYKRCH